MLKDLAKIVAIMTLGPICFTSFFIFAATASVLRGLGFNINFKPENVK